MRAWSGKTPYMDALVVIVSRSISGSPDIPGILLPDGLAPSYRHHGERRAQPPTTGQSVQAVRTTAEPLVLRAHSAAWHA